MNCPSENKFTIIPRSVADDDIAHTSNDINKNTKQANTRVNPSRESII